ncbi:MAG: hypothetical protein SNG97_06395 [Rikenellaceae bacterium]
MEKRELISGACCGDCASCTLIGESESTVPCATRITLLRVNKLMTKVEELFSAIQTIDLKPAEIKMVDDNSVIEEETDELDDN